MDMKRIQLRSCCYYMPLSKGLLTLGYLNLVFHALVFMCTVSFSLFVTVLSLGFGGQLPSFEWWLPFSILILLNIAEMVFNVLLLVATNKKDPRLLKISLAFGSVLWIFTALRSGLMTYVAIITNHTDDPEMSIVYLCFVLYVAFEVSQPFILGYALLLMWSLRVQLRRQSQGLLEEPGVHYTRV